MKKTTLPLIFLLLSGTIAMGQTKKIAFESHSGSAVNFSIALTDEFFGNEGSNFGLPSYQYIEDIKKITFLSDSVTVIEKKVYKKGWGAADSLAKLTGVRKDTLYNDPVFTRKNSADSIRNYLRTNGTGTIKISTIDSIRFKDKSGKKNQSPETKEETKPEQRQAVLAFSNADNNNTPPSPFDKQIVYMLLLILALSSAGGAAVWKLYRPKPGNQIA